MIPINWNQLILIQNKEILIAHNFFYIIDIILLNTQLRYL